MREHGQKPFVNFNLLCRYLPLLEYPINTGFHNFSTVDILGQIILFGGKTAVLCIQFSSVQFSCSVVSDFLRPHGLQHTRLPCPVHYGILNSIPVFNSLDASNRLASMYAHPPRLDPPKVSLGILKYFLVGKIPPSMKYDLG